MKCRKYGTTQTLGWPHVNDGNYHVTKFRQFGNGNYPKHVI